MILENPFFKTATHNLLYINDVENKNRHQPYHPVSTGLKKDIVILLPYLGLQSNKVAKRLKSGVYKFYSRIFVQLQGPHYSLTTIQNYLHRIEQVAGIVMVFTLLGLSNGFMIGKQNTLRPSLKMTVPKPLIAGHVKTLNI